MATLTLRPSLSLFTLLVCLGYGQPSAAVRNGEPVSAQNRLEMSRFIVSLKAPEICTASLIHPRIAITAAHCLDQISEPSEIQIGLGLSADKPDATVRAKDFKIHESYNKRRSPEDDIALILLEEPALQGDETLILPSETDTDQDILGFGYGLVHGRSSEEGLEPNILRSVSLDVDFRKDSKNIQFHQSEKGLCQGDSGGPGIAVHDGKPILMGLAKQVIPVLSPEMQGQLMDWDNDWSRVLAMNPGYDLCAHKAVYVNVRTYVPWINSTKARLLETLEEGFTKKSHSETRDSGAN